MKIAILLIAVLFVAALGVPAGAVDASRPVVVVFGSVQGEGADKALAASSTKALCEYLRQTQRVDVTIFDRESPTVLRAIMDKDLTPDQVASYSSQQERILVARALSYEYAAGAEVSVKNGMVQTRVWMAKSTGGKKDRWEASGEASVGGGSGDLNLDNAMQSGTSAAVISISRQAFLGLPPVAEKAPATPADTTAIGADLIVPPAPPSANDYASQAEASLKSGDFAVAIQQYQQAVNADPSNASLRIKLGDAYARKGLYDEATAELDHAAAMGAGEDQVDAGRQQIAELRAGKTSPNVDAVKSSTEPPRTDSVRTGETPKTDSAKTPAEAPKAGPASRPDPKAAVAKMREGDSLWRASNVDDAADAYKEAIRLNPSDWRAYERLALADVSMSLYAESRKALEQLAQVQPNPSAQTISSRYDLFSKVFEQSFAALLKQYDRDSEDYAKQRIARESYYSSIKGLGYRLETMAKFLDALPIPDDKKPVNLHRSLACGLVSQAASSLQDYLETNNADSKSNAETFIEHAKKEIEVAKKLEAKPVLAQKQPDPTPTQPAAGNSDGNAAPPQPADGSQDANAAPPQPAPDPNANQPPPQPGPEGPDPNAPPMPADYLPW
jgi:tetratricopeptide (TPR) repeat protein